MTSKLFQIPPAIKPSTPPQAPCGELKSRRGAVASEPKGDICHSWQDASAPKMPSENGWDNHGIIMGKWIRNCNWNILELGHHWQINGGAINFAGNLRAQLTQSHGGQHGNGRNHQRVVSTAVVQLDEQTPSCLRTFRAAINFGGKPYPLVI